jgi:hypothetical protein
VICLKIARAPAEQTAFAWKAAGRYTQRLMKRGERIVARRAMPFQLA